MTSYSTRRGFRFLYSFILVCIVIVALPIVIWLLKPMQPLSVCVVDKTVGREFREHRSLFWLLHHWKIVHPESHSFYNAETDYYGFFPNDSSFSKEESFQITESNIVYLADTYGVYRYPVEYEMYERKLSEQYIPSTLLYGGITEYELRQLQKYDSLRGMIVAEFNVLQEPTWSDKKIQRGIERLFGIRYNAVLGKSYEELRDVPIVIKDLYKIQTKQEWNFRGRGIVITDGRSGKEQYPKVIVLDASDLEYSPVIIRTAEHVLMNGVKDEIPYFYFFEVMETDSGAQVAAHFELRCSHSGRTKMSRAGLPLKFPAVIASDSSLRKIYFCGDFADNDVQHVLTRYWGIEYVLKNLYYFYFVSDQTRFFWRFYLPLMNNILERAIHITEQTVIR